MKTFHLAIIHKKDFFNQIQFNQNLDWSIAGTADCAILGNTQNNSRKVCLTGTQLSSTWYRVNWSETDYTICSKRESVELSKSPDKVRDSQSLAWRCSHNSTNFIIQMLFNTEILQRKYKINEIHWQTCVSSRLCCCICLFRNDNYVFLECGRIIPAFQQNPASTQDEATVPYIGPEERTGFLNRLTTLLFTIALFC